MSTIKEIDEKIDNLIRNYTDAQEKYTYYILAVNAACMAFTINLTKNSHIDVSQLPLGLAVICWCTSFYYGILQIKCRLDIIEINIKLLRNHIYNREKEEKQRLEQLQEYSLKESKYVKKLNLFLICGTLLFIIWHIIMMCINK
jgi:hypothetical protein